MHIHDTHGRMCKQVQRQKTFFKNLALMGQPHSPLKIKWATLMGQPHSPLNFICGQIWEKYVATL